MRWNGPDAVGEVIVVCCHESGRLANRPMKLMAGGGRPQLIAGVGRTGTGVE